MRITELILLPRSLTTRLVAYTSCVIRRIPAELIFSISELCDDDRAFLTTWFGFYPIAPETFEIAAQLCAPGSAADAELDELFEDARVEPEASEPASAGRIGSQVAL